MKKILSIITLLSLITVMLSGCSLFGTKVIKDELITIEKISQDKMEELVKANNDVVSTIYGNPKFFTTAELRGHISEYYDEDVIETYFTKKIFYDKDGKIVSTIKTENRKNISEMDFTINTNDISIINDKQSFEVVFSDGETEYKIEFTAIYNKNISDWVLEDIVL